MAPRRKSVLPKTKTPDEWAKMFACIDTRYPTQVRNHALLMLLYATGLRVGEALALGTHDVDFGLGKLTVVDGKTGQRIVPLGHANAEMRPSLERWLRIRGEWNPESDLLFVTSTGGPLSANAVRRTMLVYGERAGIGHISPHMLRHSAATEMLAAGAPPIGVQRCLGHRSLSTTLSVYAWAADTHAEDAMAARYAKGRARGRGV